MGSGRDAGRPRMPTWFTILLIVAVSIGVSYAAQEDWRGIVALGVIIVLAPTIRRRWREPRWSERLTPAVERHMPALWAGMGWALLAFGVFFLLAVPIGLIGGAVEGDYSIVIGSVIALPMAAVMAWGGRWLIRNRRQPFASPNEDQAP